MKRGNEDNSYETSPSLTRHLHCREITTRKHSSDINIPTDVAMEILKKLPGKSLVRFRCVSRQWFSIISFRRDFIDLIVTRSLTDPPPRDTYLIVHHYMGKNPLSFVASTYCIDRESVIIPGKYYQYVRGLIYCYSDPPSPAVIYDPTTRQSRYLPEIKPLHIDSCLFGYDPLDNQYKLVSLPYGVRKSCQVFTLGDPTVKQWRNIQCNIGHHYPLRSPVCINGAIYYLATSKFKELALFLVRFDVRSEKFNHVKAPKTQIDHSSTLINYQGKLGVISCVQQVIQIWVMEDGEKTQEWSKIVPYYKMEGFGRQWRISGVTSGGEIVFVNRWSFSHGRVVLYYDPKRHNERYVDVKGTYPQDVSRPSDIITWIVPDHVENTMCL